MTPAAPTTWPGHLARGDLILIAGQPAHIESVKPTRFGRVHIIAATPAGMVGMTVPELMPMHFRRGHQQ